jgi:predicted AAA+ superfamily ATPase
MVQRVLNLSKELGKASSALLFGARGTGKTHLCQGFLQQLQVSTLQYDLLHSETFERLLKQPHIFRLEIEAALKKSAILVFVDEIQRIPALLNEVHSLIATHKGRVRFLLTGSSARKLKRAEANLLAGRALTFRLHPLTDEEFTQPIFDAVRLGSLPGVVVDNEAPEQTLRSYVSTYLKEEIQQEALVRRVDAFARFLEVAAQYHGEIMNASAVAKFAGVSSNTVSDYFQILEDTLLGWRLPGWSASATKQLRTTPKFYLFDNGVANALRGELNATISESSSRFGKLFEAKVIQELFRLNDYYKLDFKFSYWRTNNDIEVDVVISRGAGKPLAAIEIKSSVAPEKKEFVGLSRFVADYPKAALYCICRAPKEFSREGVNFIPFQQIKDILQQL